VERQWIARETAAGHARVRACATARRYRLCWCVRMRVCVQVSHERTYAGGAKVLLPLLRALCPQPPTELAVGVIACAQCVTRACVYVRTATHAAQASAGT
jgi:hypothetical protein